MTEPPYPTASSAPPPRPPRTVGFVVHSGREEARDMAQRAAKRLTASGVRVVG